MADSNNTRKVRQYVIAEHLGISRSTVSKVLTNRKGVSEETRLRVIGAAREMGYDYESPSQPKLNCEVPRIGILVRLGSEAPSNHRVDYLESLSSYAIESQIALSAHFIPSTQSDEEFFKKRSLQPVSLRDGEIDALLLAGPWSEQAMIHASQLLPCSALVFGTPYSSVDTTEPDTFGAFRQIVEHLKERNHRRLAFVGFAPDIYWSTERYAAYLTSCAHAGIEAPKSLVLEVNSRMLWDPNAEEAWNSVVQNAICLIQNQRVTGLVCSGDWAAVNVYSGLRNHGVSIPEDVSITGFDDGEVLTLGGPKISSIHIPRTMLAREAIGRLIRRIATPRLPVKRSLYECNFVDNGTTGIPGSLA